MLETLSSADLLLRPTVIVLLVMLYLLQSAWRIKRLPEMLASLLRYALWELTGPGTVLTEVMHCDGLEPRKIVQEVL